jgi:hypothetical protein
MEANMKKAAKTNGTYLLIAATLCRPAAAVAKAPAANLWPSDSLTKVMHSHTPAQTAPHALVINGARGEIASGQAVFRPEEDLSDATFEISNLTHKDSNSAISASAVKLQWVRYINITRNSKGIPQDELLVRAPAGIPDPFWENRKIAVKARQAQPLWIEIHVPRDAEHGDYHGTLQVRHRAGNLKLPVRLHVWNFTLPADRHLAVINWWKFPGIGFTPQPYSEEYFQLLDKFCNFVVEHRQTDILARLDLITIKKPDEQGHCCDTTLLERWAQITFRAGVRRIHLHRVGYKTAGYSDPKGRIELNKDNLRRLRCAEEMIQRRGWQDRFLVSISDEPFVQHEPSYARAVEQVHALAPSIRCIEAVEAEYLGKLDVYVPKLSHLNLWYNRFEKIRRQGSQLWFYVCCHPVGRYPNRFLDQSLLKARVLFWIHYLYQLDGYLHWGLNQFRSADPYSEHGIAGSLPPGDPAIAYPGKDGLVGSLRFSAQRDGLQDYEYLWTLQDKLRRIKDNAGENALWLEPRQRPLELCRRVIWSFHDYTRDPGTLLQTRVAIAEEIEALETKPMLVVQTSPPEGTAIPAGPRHIIIRGLTCPGAKVTVNRNAVNVNPDGYFSAYWFLSDNQSTITVTATSGTKQRTAIRKFLPTQ